MKNKPKKDSSGQGIRKNKNRSNCNKPKQGKGKQAQLKKLSTILIISLIFITGFVLAIPLITHEDNPIDGFTTSDKSVELNFNITEANLKEVKFSWNETNYTIFDENLVLAFNFNNLSALSENDTHVFDISGNGNNGTVQGGNNISWTSDGKYDGAFNFSGKKSSIDISSVGNDLNMANGTISMWINVFGETGSTVPYIFRTNSNTRIQFYWDYNSNKIVYGTSAPVKLISTNVLNFNQWYYLTGNWLQYNSTHSNYSIYLDGSLVDSIMSNISTNNPTTIYLGALGSLNQPFNGTIDELRIWNKSLSASKIQQNYIMNLKKYDSDKWSLWVNQSIKTINLTSANPNEIFTYFACATNSSDSENCTETRTITRGLIDNNITSNFSLSIGDIRNDFYGSSAGTFSEFNYITSDLTCNRNILSDKYNISRNAFLNANLKIMRMNMKFEGNSNEDGTFYTTNKQHNIQIRSDNVKWAFESNKTIILIADRMPEWLANKTTGWCLLSGTTNSTCPPKNYTRWGELVVDYLDNVTINGIYSANVMVEVWNEPAYSSWLNNLSADDIIKSIEYNKLYNATYDAVKDAYPNIEVIGIGGENNNTPNIVNNWFSNFFNKNDGYSTHEYYDLTDGFTDILNTINIMNNICLSNGGNCSNIYLTEWNLKSLNNSYTNYHIATYGNTYLNLLNNYQSNLSNMVFKFESEYENSSCDSTYNYSIFNQFSSTYSNIYNTTKAFATYCPAGATVYTSTSTTNDLVAVTCKKGNMHNTIVINKGDEAINLTLNLINFTESTIYDLETKTAYTVTDNSTNIGSIDQYEIIYLGSDLQSPTITINSPSNTTYSSNTTYFNLTLSEEGDTCYYSLDGEPNITMNKQGVVSQFKSINSTMTDGTKTVTFYCNDTWNNWNSTSIAFTIDITNPNVNLLTPLNNTNSSSSNNFTSNLTDNHGLVNATIYIHNSTDLVNQTTVTFAGNPLAYTWGLVVSLIDNIYTWYVETFDLVGNSDVSSNYTVTIDTTAPLISNFQFKAINSSQEQIGTDETAFNFTNLEEIEYMNISFEITDLTGINGDIKIYFTANGTNACSLGNNQSTICYNYDSSWIEYANGTDTSTFRDIGGSAQGDSITCSYTGNNTFRNYTCQIDEHYNPNVWKHYPLNFSDMKWQSGLTERIKKNTVWKTELDMSNIPLDADYYKIDCRVNATIGLTPTQALLTYLCNSTYSTGDPSINPNCQLTGGFLPSDLQDDGTKLRGIFTSSLINSMGDIKYALMTTDSPASKYYSPKTYGFLGSDAIRTQISNDNGATYSTLSDGYETELNINWFYDSNSSNPTQILFKIYSNDTLGNNANSSIQTLTWDAGVLNERPIVDIIVPEINSNNTNPFQINWTTAEPNGDTYTTNITLSNSTGTYIINSTLSSSIIEVLFNSDYDGTYNLTIESCENSTSDLFCGNDTHLILIDNTNPLISFNPNTDADNSNKSSADIFVNYSTSDLNDIYSFIDFDGSLAGHYRFEENANDDTGINNGTSNAVSTNGRFGQAYDFDGTTLVNISHSDSLNIQDSITISSWVKIDTYSAYDRIIAKSPPTSSYPYTIYGLLTDQEVAGNKLVRMELASGGIQHVIRSTTGITEGEWFLLTGTHDRDTNITKLYLNGVLDNSTLLKSYVNGTEVISNITKIDTNTEPITIGRANYGAGLDGKIDEVLIFNRSLSSEEVMSLYNSSSNYHNFTNLADGTHTFKSYVIDLVGNKNETEQRSVYIDDSAPTIILTSPEDNSADTDGIVRFLFTPTDTNNIENCSLVYQNGVYTTSTSISNGVSNVIEVVSINYQHVLYLDDLQWRIDCTDEYNNVGSSETRNLDTREDEISSDDGGGGGGSSSGTTTLQNPKNIDLFYPEVWYRDSNEELIIKVYNQAGELYSPEVLLNFSIDGVQVSDSKTDFFDQIVNTFQISKTATLGEHNINIQVKDEKIIERDIKIIIEEKKEKKITDLIDTSDEKFLKILLYTVGGLIVFIILIILVASISGDKKTKE